jgi:hypothetical protein
MHPSVFHALGVKEGRGFLLTGWQNKYRTKTLWKGRAEGAASAIRL